MQGKSDATWIFENWEGEVPILVRETQCIDRIRSGVEASMEAIELRTFKMESFGVPYGYSPLLLISESTVRVAELRRFLVASRKGFDFAMERPNEAAEILQRFVPPQTKSGLVIRSQKYLSGDGYYGDPGSWGKMSPSKWEAWIKWLRARNLLRSRDGTEISSFEIETLYTNEFF